MYIINTDKVIGLVCMYAHLPPTRRGEAVELSEDAAAYLSGALLREPENANEETACIHAAACLALCDLARINASAFEPVVTETGSFAAQGKGSVTVEAAEKLRDDALKRLGDMYYPAEEPKEPDGDCGCDKDNGKDKDNEETDEYIDDFFFEGVDG